MTTDRWTDRWPGARSTTLALLLGACLAIGACVSRGDDGPPDRLWIQATPPRALRAAPDGPDLRAYEVVPYLGWEPVLKFTRGQPEHAPLVYVSPTARYDEHGIPRKFGERPTPSTYLPTGETAENADGTWHEHVRR